MSDVQFVFKLKDKITSSLSKIEKSFDRFEGKLAISNKKIEEFNKRTENITKVGRRYKELGQKLTTGVTLPLTLAGGAMIKLASDMEETMNKVDVSFGQSSDKVKEWAKSSIKSMGLSQRAALDSAALYGDMATGMGLSQEKASQMAMSLTQLGADLASFKNISNDVAQTALKSIFTGETESLKNLGVVMTQTNLERFAMSKGIRKKIKDMSEAEKIQLRYNYVMNQTKNAHGDFIRTGGGAANQMRIFQNNVEELAITFGTHLLPLFTRTIKKINGLLEKFNAISPSAQKTILALSGIALAIGPVISLVGNLTLAVKGLNVALQFSKKHPLMIAISLIATATAGTIALIKHFKKLKELREQEEWENLQGGDKNKFSSSLKDKPTYTSTMANKPQYGSSISKIKQNSNKPLVNNTTSTNNNTTNNTTVNNYYAPISATNRTMQYIPS